MLWLFVSRLPCPCCTHTHILALSAKQFGNQYCNCVVSELVIDQLGVGLAYRSAGWQVAGKERRQTCTRAHPPAHRSADAQQEKEGELGLCRHGTAALQSAAVHRHHGQVNAYSWVLQCLEQWGKASGICHINGIIWGNAIPQILSLQMWNEN